MRLKKYKCLCGVFLTAMCFTLYPSQAHMASNNHITLKGLSQHQTREETAVIALATAKATDNVLDQKSITTNNHSVADKINAILKGENKQKNDKKNDVKKEDITPIINYNGDSILGSAIASQEQCVKYLLQRNPNPKISVSAEKLVKYYYEEASKEGIRPDAAFAQALKETGYFNYGGTVTPDQNNYCGLGTTSATVKGAYFDTARLGVRAHIQHLLAYTSVRPPREDVIDPRYSLVRAVYSSSTIDTWPGLNGRWAVPGNNYGQEILQILDNITRE